MIFCTLIKENMNKRSNGEYINKMKTKFARLVWDIMVVDGDAQWYSKKSLILQKRHTGTFQQITNGRGPFKRIYIYVTYVWSSDMVGFTDPSMWGC